VAGPVTDSTVMGMKRRLVSLAGILSATGLVAGPLRRLSSRSGVGDEEVARALPGDELLAGAGHVIDRAVTIPAPAATVWPWIVQMGKQRAGWYFPRWVELAIPRGRRGFRTVDPSLLDLLPGQRVPDWGPGDPQFEVVQIEPEQALVYLSLRQKSRNWTWPDPSDSLPEDVLAFSWALVLRPVDEAHCRLHLRLRMRTARGRSPAMFFGGLFDWVTVALLFAGLRERVGP